VHLSPEANALATKANAVAVNNLGACASAMHKGI
jgi:hypothetical protein